MTKTLAIREAIIAIIQKQLSKVIAESDSLIRIKAIGGDIYPPSQIMNVIEDIKIRAKVVKNIIFVYCSRSANVLTNLVGRQKGASLL